MPHQKSTPFHKFRGAITTTSDVPRWSIAHVICFQFPTILSLIIPRYLDHKRFTTFFKITGLCFVYVYRFLKWHIAAIFHHLRLQNGAAFVTCLFKLLKSICQKCYKSRKCIYFFILFHVCCSLDQHQPSVQKGKVILYCLQTWLVLLTI